MNKINKMEEVLRHSFGVNGRRTGKTTALAKACKENDGILVCYNKIHADYIKKEFGCKTIPQDDLHKLEGSRCPVMFDTDVLVKLLSDSLLIIENKQTKLNKIADILGTEE